MYKLFLIIKEEELSNSLYEGKTTPITNQKKSLRAGWGGAYRPIALMNLDTKNINKILAIKSNYI